MRFRLRFGVDTADNLLFSCFVSGSKTEIDKTYSAMDKILVAKNQRGAFHWKSYTSKVRKTVATDLLKVCKGHTLRYLIFEHRKPQYVQSKKYYLRDVVNNIGGVLERQIKNKPIDITFVLDDDFHIPTVRDGTHEFARCLLQNLSYRLTGTLVAVRGRRSLICELKLMEKQSKFVAFKSSRGSSKEIQIADVILGLYRFLPKGKTKDIFRVHKV